MSTSLLYHGFGVRGYRYLRTKYEAGGVVFVIERKAETCRCSACGSANVWRQGVVTRRFRTVSIGKKPVELEAMIPRLACQDCGKIRQAAIDFAEPRRTYTIEPCIANDRRASNGSPDVQVPAGTTGSLAMQTSIGRSSATYWNSRGT